MPDSVIQRAAAGQSAHVSLDSRQQILGGFMTPYSRGTSGTITPGFSTSTRIDLNQIGEARNSMLSIKLDQVRLIIHSLCNSLTIVLLLLLLLLFVVAVVVITRFLIVYQVKQ